MKQQRKNAQTEKWVMCAILTAIVIVLQLLCTFVRVGPFSITLALMPIIIGAALYGPLVGGWLGLVFGVVVLLVDASAFLAVDVLGTVVTVLAKGFLAGFVAGLVYKAVEKLNTYVAVAAAAVVSPLVNTGIFFLGCQIFFMPTISSWAGKGESAMHFLIFGMIGFNFIVEMVTNAILCPAVVRLLKIGKKTLKK
ncbi:MAG: ECF transporter S component [Ruminococcaceae bacterium]|nr:ECF transporter S component [Oscillospiraceae bacterium]